MENKQKDKHNKNVMEEKNMRENYEKDGEEQAGKAAGASAMLGVALTLIGGIFWGLSGACGQFLFNEKGITSGWLVPVRLTVSGLVMVLYFVIKEKGGAFRIWKKKRDAVDILIYGIFGLMLCQFTYFKTIEYSNAAVATVLQYLAPALIVVMVCFMERRAPKLLEITALTLAVAGIFVIATHGNIRELAMSKEALIVGLISALTVVLYNLQPRRMLLYYPSAYLLGWGMLVGGVVLALIFRPWQYQVSMDMEILLALFAIIIMGSVIAFTLYTQGIKLIGPVKASLYACIEPISATVLSTVWLKVPFTGMDFLGFGLIIGAILVLSMPERKKA